MMTFAIIVIILLLLVPWTSLWCYAFSSANSPLAYEDLVLPSAVKRVYNVNWFGAICIYIGLCILMPYVILASFISWLFRI